MEFSICIPTYNRSYIIRRALDSILKQTYHNYEVLIIDDGSTDDTYQNVKPYLDKPNWLYIKKENGGKHTALNTGIRHAKAELFIILDSDDWLMPDTLENMHHIWKNISNKEVYCGIMGRSVDQYNNLIGKPFDKNPKITNYIKFHYLDGFHSDCCECLRLDILKQHSWPEIDGVKFVPESLVTDRIGKDFLLYSVNVVFRGSEYLDDGITKDAGNHLIKNAGGYLIDTISKLDEIFPLYNISFYTKLKTWFKYWKCLKATDQTILRQIRPINSITPIGYMVKYCYEPIKLLSLLKRKLIH